MPETYMYHPMIYQPFYSLHFTSLIEVEWPLADKSWDDAYMFQAFEGIIRTCYRRCMYIFKGFCPLLPLLELLNM